MLGVYGGRAILLFDVLSHIRILLMLPIQLFFLGTFPLAHSIPYVPSFSFSF